jgi:hypothetical protein
MMTEHPAVRISIETDTAAALGRAVNSGLYAYNDQFAAPMENSMLAIGARDADKKIIGAAGKHVNQDACMSLSTPLNFRHAAFTKSRAIASTRCRRIIRPATESF